MITFAKKKADRIPFARSHGLSHSKYFPLYKAYLDLKEGEVLAIPIEGSVYEFQNKISTTMGMFTKRHGLPGASVRKVGAFLHVFPKRFKDGAKNLLDASLEEVREWKAAYDREQEVKDD